MCIRDRLFYQAPLHRIAMHVTQFLDALALGPDIEVIIARCQKCSRPPISLRATDCFIACSALASVLPPRLYHFAYAHAVRFDSLAQRAHAIDDILMGDLPLCRAKS